MASAEPRVGRACGHRISGEANYTPTGLIPYRGWVLSSEECVDVPPGTGKSEAAAARYSKLRGQLDAVERSLLADEDCGGQLMLLAAVRGGVNGLMGEVLETHIRFHLFDGAKEQIAPELAEDLIDLVRAYLK